MIVIFIVVLNTCCTITARNHGCDVIQSCHTTQTPAQKCKRPSSQRMNYLLLFFMTAGIPSQGKAGNHRKPTGPPFPTNPSQKKKLPRQNCKKHKKKEIHKKNIEKRRKGTNVLLCVKKKGHKRFAVCDHPLLPQTPGHVRLFKPPTVAIAWDPPPPRCPREKRYFRQREGYTHPRARTARCAVLHITQIVDHHVHKKKSHKNNHTHHKPSVI